MKKIKNSTSLLVIMAWFIQVSHSCVNRGVTIKKPPPPPPWFGISSYGRIINTECDCGNSTLEKEKEIRIVVGKNVTYTTTDNIKFPWLVYIKVAIGKDYDYRKITDADGSYDCSGTLINDRFVLTSAECVYQYDPIKNHLDVNENMKRIKPHQVKVWMMMPDRTKFESSKTEEVAKIIIHPDFPFKTKASDERQTDNDIALLKLKRAINFKTEELLRPICIHQSSIPIIENEKSHLDPQEKTAIGWWPKSDKLESFHFNTTECPKEDIAKSSLDLRNYFCSTENHEPRSGYPIMNFGSPVIGHLTAGNLRAYQYGILSWVLRIFLRRGKFHRRLTKVRLFTNIYRPDILSFIDYHSYMAKAQWCSDSVDMNARSLGTLKSRHREPQKKSFHYSSESVSEESPS